MAIAPVLAPRSPAGGGVSPSRRRGYWRTTALAYLFLLPAVVIIAIFHFFAVGFAFYISLFNWKVASGAFLALTNYAVILQDSDFHQALVTTIWYAVLTVPISIILALFAALLLSRNLRGVTIFRTLFFIPYVTSTVAVTAVFMDLFTVRHPLPRLFALVGLPDTSWYADVHLALPFIALIYVWMSIGLYMVIFLSGLQSISPELHEAAMVDGANRAQVFWRITLPLLRPFTFFVLVSGMIQAFQVFDQAYVVSGGTVLGGPAGATSTIVIYIFAEAFRYNRLGTASSAAVILLFVVSAATAALRSIFREEAAVAR